MIVSLSSLALPIYVALYAEFFLSRTFFPGPLYCNDMLGFELNLFLNLLGYEEKIVLADNVIMGNILCLQLNPSSAKNVYL